MPSYYDIGKSDTSANEIFRELSESTRGIVDIKIMYETKILSDSVVNFVKVRMFPL